VVEKWQMRRPAALVLRLRPQSPVARPPQPVTFFYRTSITTTHHPYPAPVKMGGVLDRGDATTLKLAAIHQAMMQVKCGAYNYLSAPRPRQKNAGKTYFGDPAEAGNMYAYHRQVLFVIDLI
jgi:hypothetical protein